MKNLLFLGSGCIYPKMASQPIIINNQQRNGFFCTLIGAISNIFLNLILIYKYSINGAAFATMAAQIISGFVSPIWFRIDKRYPIIALSSLNLINFFIKKRGMKYERFS